MREEIRKRAEMIRRGDVPEGYKQTKVGIIPGEWEVRQIKDFGKVITGSTPPTKDNSYYNGEFPWVTPTDINGEKYIDSTLKQLTKKGLEKSRILPEDSVLVTCIASIGKNCILKSKGSCNQQINAIVVNSKNNFEFLYYVISHNTDRMKVFAGQTATQIINKTTFEKFTIASPQLNEQTAIANILSTSDKAIETTETLITLKEQKKKWLMQNLLTGKVRLPGFKNPWKKFKLGNLFKERNERKQNSIYELLSITSEKGVQKRTEIDRKDNSSHDKSKYKVIYQNDIGYNTMRMWQGVSGVSYYKGIISPAYTVLAPREGVHSIFMGYLFKLPKTINLFKRYSQGLVNDTLSLKYANFKKIVVLVPEYDEQTAIANILSTADKEITLLHQKLDTLKQQKKALMQLLLTGIVRTTGLNISSDTEEEGVAYVQ